MCVREVASGMREGLIVYVCERIHRVSERV